MGTVDLHLEESDVWVTPGQTLGEGGEGVVRAVQGHPYVAVKQRLDGQPLPGREVKRLRALIALNLPDCPTNDTKLMCAWPREIVSDSQGHAVGFAMRRAPGKPLRLSALLSIGGREKHTPNLSFALTTKLAADVLRIAHACHALGIVLCDVNDRGILLADNRELWLIDLDSVQFAAADGTGYLSATHMPDYLAPESDPATFDSSPRTVAEDTYTLSYLAFRILMAGFEPYDGRRPDRRPVDLAEHAKSGFYAYSSNGSPVEPPLRAPSIGVLSPEVAGLFERTFVAGAVDPSIRTGTRELAQALDRQASAFVPCGGRRTHFIAAGPVCPWCEWEQRIGIVSPSDAAERRDRAPNINPVLKRANAVGHRPLPARKAPQPAHGVAVAHPKPSGNPAPLSGMERRPVNWPPAVHDLIARQSGGLSTWLLALHWPAWLDSDGRKIAVGIVVAITVAWLLFAVTANAAVAQTAKETIG